MASPNGRSAALREEKFRFWIIADAQTEQLYSKIGIKIFKYRSETFIAQDNQQHFRTRNRIVLPHYIFLLCSGSSLVCNRL